MDYRPDIEGMRALAILLVAAAHVGIPGLQGGFIGVDVFFVISGYLITGLLVSEHVGSGRIDIARFYARRFKRLLPALLAMLLAVACAAMALLPPGELAYQAGAGAAASLWTSNLYFALEKIDYFGFGAESNLYLHTWSLGVEEQFYLVWPFLVMCLLRVGSRSNAILARGMIAVLVVSLVACIVTTHQSARMAFYLMPLRAWQFAAGALAWGMGTRLLGCRSGRWVAEALGAAGVALLVAALLLIGGGIAYPGGWAMLPTLGAVCLLLAGIAARPSVTRLLSLPPMQWVGRLSYSWYLWHWPVLVLGAVLIPAAGLTERILLVVVAFGLAILSYLLVERPIRRNDALVREPRRFILACLLLMLGCVALFMRMGDAARGQATAVASGPSLGADSVPVIYAMGCDDWYRSDRLVPCIFGAESAPKTAIVIGDSIGLHWFPAYARIFKAPEWKLIVLTKSSCPMVDSRYFDASIGREFTECATWRNRALDYISDVRPDLVIMGGSHTTGFDKETWITGTQRVLARVAPYSRHVRIMRSTPLLPFNGPACAWAHRDSNEPETCSAPDGDKLNADVATWLAQAAQGFGNVAMLDMNDAVCPGGICRAERNGILAYRDVRHLTAFYVESMANELRSRLGHIVESGDD